ncbi:transposase [Streptomyces sp. NPDC097619]|uniref:IS701 family transposase n=1 Tax=Streptomyces sp. NPDC097619 TaxID=3157228 RepID=UPI0033191D21
MNRTDGLGVVPRPHTGDAGPEADGAAGRGTGGRSPGRAGNGTGTGSGTQEFHDALFASLPRRDQRLKGEQYLRGLRVARGRKSIRNIAAHLGEAAMEQSLHHFISSSTWDWTPVRAALAARVAGSVAPHALVVQPMAIVKTGEQSVGVDRAVDPRTGHAFRGQTALGVWQTAPSLSVPVHWRLYLPDSWTTDPRRRRRAEIPAEVGAESLEESAVAAALEAVPLVPGPRRPVVLDLPVNRAGAVLRQFTAAGVPAVVRITGEVRCTVEDPSLPGYGGGPLPARQVLAGVRSLRRPAAWTDPADPGTSRTSLVTTVRVGLPGGSPTSAAGGGALLFGEWAGPRTGPGADPYDAPTALWVTNTARVRAETLLRTTRLADRATHALEHGGDAAGLRDFEGRSFRGWHRHITLASAAQALAALAELEGQRERAESGPRVPVQRRAGGAAPAAGRATRAALLAQAAEHPTGRAGMPVAAGARRGYPSALSA